LRPRAPQQSTDTATNETAARPPRLGTIPLSSSAAAGASVRVLSSDEAGAMAEKLSANLKKDWNYSYSSANNTTDAQKDWTDKLHQTQFILRKIDTRSEIVIGCSSLNASRGLVLLRTRSPRTARGTPSS